MVKRVLGSLNHRSLRVMMLCALLLVFGASCALTMGDLLWDNPRAEVVYICDKPLDVPDSVKMWGYNYTTKRLVTGEDELQLRLFDSADAYFEYDPEAPISSVSKMPSEYGLTCKKRAVSFPDASASFFASSSELFRSQEPCPTKVGETVDRPDPRWFAETSKTKCNPGQAKTVQRRVYVCARPKGIDKNIDEWTSRDKKGNLVTTSAKEFAAAVANADLVFVFDKTAPPESVYWFVTDPKQLSCPGKPPQPYTAAMGSGMVDMLNAAQAMSAALGANPKNGDGKTTDTSSKDGKGPPLDFLESLTRNLQYTAALANGDTSADPKDPSGTRFGMLGGKDANGPDLQPLQAAAGVFAIIGIPFKSSKDFVKKITRALSEGKTPVILDPQVLTKEMAEKLAAEPTEKELKAALDGLKQGDTAAFEALESFGTSMAPSLSDAGMILPYSRAQAFTKGWRGEFQAHHILEVNMFDDMGKLELAANSPSIILTKEQHKAITNKLAEAQGEMMKEVARRGNKPPLNPTDVWKMYQKVYKDQPNWLKAIEHYFQP